MTYILNINVACDDFGNPDTELNMVHIVLLNSDQMIVDLVEFNDKEVIDVVSDISEKHNIHEFRIMYNDLSVSEDHYTVDQVSEKLENILSKI